MIPNVRPAMPRLSLPVILLAALCAAGLPWIARGDDQDQEQARQAVERGEIRPLDQVLQAVQARVPGEVVDVELEREDGRWVYEIKVITASGKRQEVEIDASSLEILEVD